MAVPERGAQRSGATAPAPGRGGAVVRGPPTAAVRAEPTPGYAECESAWRIWRASSAGVVRALRPLVEGIT